MGSGEAKFEVHRLKARVTFVDGAAKIIQGVREVFEILDEPRPDSAKAAPLLQGKMVLIGRNLGGWSFQESLTRSLATS